MSSCIDSSGVRGVDERLFPSRGLRKDGRTLPRFRVCRLLRTTRFTSLLLLFTPRSTSPGRKPSEPTPTDACRHSNPCLLLEHQVRALLEPCPRP